MTLEQQIAREIALLAPRTETPCSPAPDHYEIYLAARAARAAALIKARRADRALLASFATKEIPL